MRWAPIICWRFAWAPVIMKKVEQQGKMLLRHVRYSKMRESICWIYRVVYAATAVTALRPKAILAKIQLLSAKRLRSPLL